MQQSRCDTRDLADSPRRAAVTAVVVDRHGQIILRAQAVAGIQMPRALGDLVRRELRRMNAYTPVIAVLVLALEEPQLRLVVSTDEFPDRRRAQLARHLLDSVGRDDVHVVAGMVLRDQPDWAATDLFQASDVRGMGNDVFGAVTAVVAAARGPIRLLGLGPLTDLATVLAMDLIRPDTQDIAARVRVVQSADRLPLAPIAAHAVLGSRALVTLVSADHTSDPAVVLTADHPVVQALGESEAAWAARIRAHLDRLRAQDAWPTTVADLLAVSIVLNLPFVGCVYRQIALSPDARITDGISMRARQSVQVDFAAFTVWITETLRTDRAGARPPVWTSIPSREIVDRLLTFGDGDRLTAANVPVPSPEVQS